MLVAGKFAWVLHVKLPVKYLWYSGKFTYARRQCACVLREVIAASKQVNLPVITGKLHVTQVNCARDLFTCELHVKLLAFAGNFARASFTVFCQHDAHPSELLRIEKACSKMKWASWRAEFGTATVQAVHSHHFDTSPSLAIAALFIDEATEDTAGLLFGNKLEPRDLKSRLDNASVHKLHVRKAPEIWIDRLWNFLWDLE